MLVCLLLMPGVLAFAQEPVVRPTTAAPAGAADIFDDKELIQGYALKLCRSPKDLLLAMINDV